MVITDNIECNLLKELGFPELSEVFQGHDLDNINFELYLLFHYLSDTNFFKEDDSVTKLVNNDNFRIITESITVPEEWSLSFMCKIDNIEGRRFLFEHYINDQYETFKGFNKVDYQESHLDRIIGELSSNGVNNISESFDLIQKTTYTIAERKIIFEIIYHLLGRGEDVSGALDESIHIFEGIKDELNREYLTNSMVNDIRQSILLLKIHGETLSLNSLIKNKDLYKFIPNIFFTNYGESNAMTDFIHSAGKKYRPEIINDADSLKSQAQRGIKNVKIGTGKIKKYIPVDEIKKIITAPVLGLKEKVRSIELPLGIKYNVEQLILEPLEDVSSSFDKVKNSFSLGTDLLVEDFNEKHSNLGERNMEFHLKNHKDDKQIDYMSDEEYYALYRKYYSFLKITKTIQNSFESNNSGVKKMYEQTVWKRGLYYFDRYFKKYASKYLLKIKLVPTLLKMIGTVGIKAKIFYTLLVIYTIDKIKSEFKKLDVMKKFDTPEYASPLLISPEYSKFLSDNLNELNTISIGLEELEEAKRLEFEHKKLKPILEKYEESIAKIETSDNVSNKDREEAFSHILEMVKTEEKLEEISALRKKFLSDYISGDFSARENNALNEISKFMKEENRRENTSFIEYNNTLSQKYS